ncbi:MAG: alpha/beta hydrolase [Curvibacter sp. RIFCSPHIGHO2_12_FULL_63_18]|uniref:alpha/beta fold hydrolase n=1 Tax=Rhodoferax sp. TaxID=50421 RepID=UPI0008C9FE13|nr:alpha/beta hydrolase [Rhodoferax sp.]OGO95720.1 MAG: alpha/beta hydrolase [Curvibacter sp. GWA2_63_95]OGO99969.1 MAG: alpha/beta hydrolase [Curvibacter sp. RIFCSPHIGHO2_12_FULL_63_18]HCX81936.1 alpha/beta hydrolase [Rhodoferax sp.]
MYQVKRPCKSEFVPIRNLRYHVQVWGEPGVGKVPLVMVHGWMDVAASYQFVVDAFAQDHYIIAPDWRGYGQTKVPATDSYWFPDYLADLDFLLDHYAPGQPVNLVGHSMGGNVVMLYGGVRPERIRRLVNLEGFGMPATRPAQAPGRFASWMDELKKLHAGEMDLKAYDSANGVARRLMKTNPRLGQDKADWLARHWAAENTEGKWSIQGDAAHKISNAQLYRVEEVLEIYKRLTMPVLAVEASDNSLDLWWKGKFTLAEYHERLQVVPNAEVARIEDAGHMMHHDQPEVLAALIERFIA